MQNLVEEEEWQLKQIHFFLSLTLSFLIAPPSLCQEEELGLEHTRHELPNLFHFITYYFSNCTSTGTNTGHDIYVGNDWKGDVKEEMLTSCLSTKDRGDNSVYVEGEGDKDSWLPSSLSSLYLSSAAGIDFLVCGNVVEKPCKNMENINKLLSLFSTPPSPFLHIHLISPVTLDSVEEVGGKSFVSSDEIHTVELIAPEEVDGEGETWIKNSSSAEFIRIIFSFPSLFFSFS
jgi:hypothetical protein